MHLSVFIYGIVLALGLIVPLGVQNIFIFNQGATQKHFLHALPSVLTASICDTLLISMSILGISVIVLTLPWLKAIIFTIGCCFLFYMSWITWHNSPKNLNQQKKPFSARRQILFSASVSLLNPHAIIDSIGVIGTNSLHFMGEDKWVYTFACILASWIWFFSLSVTGHFVHKLDKSGFWLKSINKLSAIIIFSVAVYLVYQLYILYHSCHVCT
jgi:L-lysine exporter family protein LysE/ArgO